MARRRRGSSAPPRVPRDTILARVSSARPQSRASAARPSDPRASNARDSLRPVHQRWIAAVMFIVRSLFYLILIGWRDARIALAQTIDAAEVANVGRSPWSTDPGQKCRQARGTSRARSGARGPSNAGFLAKILAMR